MEPEKKKETIVVKTYAEDMAGVLENDREGLVKKIIHGEEAHEEEKKQFSPQSKQNQFFLWGSLVLVVLGFLALSYLIFGGGPLSVPVEEQFVPLVFNDKTSFVEISDLKKDALAQVVLNQTNKSTVKKSGLEGIYLTLNKKPIGLREFLSVIKSSFVPTEDKTIVSDQVLLGLVNVETEEEERNRPGFFILMKMRSRADVFDTMRAWEEKMFFDLHGFFGYELLNNTTYLLTKDFEDGIIDNKNARLLYGDDGKLVLMYVFADDNSIIITNSKDAVRELVLRLASKQTKE